MKTATYIKHVIAKLSKFVQTACRLPQIPFYIGFFENLKGIATSFQATFCVEFFDKKFYFAILHKLAKFHYQTMFTSQVMQYNVFRVSWLNI